MESKPPSRTAKDEAPKPSEQEVKGTTETARLFLDMEQLGRRLITVPLTRYVE